MFSRAGCDAAVKQCLRSSLRLTTDEERARIAEVIDRRCGDLPDADLVVLGYHEWREGLLRGLAAHHAGMLPVFRHTVEELFTAGLVKAVFATETLALGINMPARTVVLERLVKFNGEQHVPLTPGEYTQLTGRAGPARHRRRGPRGGAVAPRTVEPAEVAGLASTRTFPLRSSFAPSYNMTINLVHQMGPAQAHQLLERSFAQYQADRSVVGLVRGIERGERMLDEIAAELGGRGRARSSTTCGCARRSPNGSGHRPARRGCSAARRPTTRWRRCAAATSSPSPTGGAAGWPWCWSPPATSDDPRPLVLTENRWAGRISSADYSGASAPVGSMTLPKRVEHRQPRVRRDLASALRSAAAGLAIPARAGAAAPPREPDVDPELAALREQLRRHPAHRLPDREEQVRARRAVSAHRTRQRRRSQQKVAAATNSLARTFDRIVVLLTERGFIRDADGDPRVTDDGRLLARIYSESDLLVAECLRSGVWEGLAPAELAAVLSAVLYESRGDDGRRPAGRRDRRPASCAARWPRPAGCRPSCAPTSSGTASRQSREPDEGFVAAIYRWATTGDLAAALAASDSRAPVRRCRRATSCGGAVRFSTCSTRCATPRPTPELRAAAKRAIDDVRRGVVAVDAG